MSKQRTVPEYQWNYLEPENPAPVPSHCREARLRYAVMTTLLLLTIYCSLVVASSLAGGALPGLVKLTHRRMQWVMSFVGGLMLGVAVLHLLPHSVAEQGSIDRAALWLLGGLLTMFLLIRVFHVHAHEHGDVGDVVDEHRHAHDHEGPCEHGHHITTTAARPKAATPSVGWAWRSACRCTR